MKKKSTSQPARHRLSTRRSPAVAGRKRLGEGGLRRAVASREGGFFNLRVLIGLLVVLTGILLALLSFGTLSNVSAQPNAGSTNLPGQDEESLGQQAGQMRVIRAVHSDLSRPLRDQPVEWPQAREEREPHVNPKLPIKHHDRPDPVIQSSFSQQLMTTLAIPAPTRQWAGIAGGICNPFNPGRILTCGVPPDTNGAVGKTQYVEMVNDALQVFDKLTGTSLLGPISIASIWTGFGGPCYTRGKGDPIVVYDRLADRWVISQFAQPAGATEAQDECIAVSQTGDATGAWYRYDFHLTFRFPDYPKFGVWPDGYYMSANIFRTDPLRDPAVGAKPFVFDRAKMLVGDPTATLQTTKGVISPDLLLPSDLDGVIPPPAGAPNFFVAVTIATEEEEAPAPGGARENAPPPPAAPSAATPPPLYKVWAYHVDWNHPKKSSFTLRANVPAADFTVLCPNTRECVPQKGVPDPLDGEGDRLMFRNAYRRFPDGRESLLNNFTVSANSVAGIRWFELRRRVPGNWSLRQQSTYAPDSTWRWMGSIASDNQGNIALGFSASSETIHPQIRYASRLATDPLNTLSGERHLFDGTGSQIDRPCDPDKDPECEPEPPTYRWGDYSDMTVDPEDDCTFYYTNEYYEKTSEFYWKTRIGYFKFAQCTPPPKGTGAFVVTACNGGAPIHNASVSIDNRPYGATLSNGSYDAVLTPDQHSYTVSHPGFAMKRGTFTIINGQSTPVEVCL